MAIEVTVRDTGTGETQTATIQDDYILVTAGTCYRSAVQAYPGTGTHVITVKGCKQLRGDGGAS